MHRHTLRRRVPVAVAATLLVAGPAAPDRAHAKTDLVDTRQQTRQQRPAERPPATTAALRAARTRIGSGYAMGATGPAAFDCSGLTLWAFARAGVALPHSSFAQYAMGRPVERGDVRAGDLVFFATNGPGASHVGVATGKGTAVSATSSGVMEHSMADAYWGGAYVGARRVTG